MATHFKLKDFKRPPGIKVGRKTIISYGRYYEVWCDLFHRGVYVISKSKLREVLTDREWKKWKELR